MMINVSIHLRVTDYIWDIMGKPVTYHESFIAHLSMIRSTTVYVTQLRTEKKNCQILGFRRLVMQWSHQSCAIFAGRKKEIVIKDIGGAVEEVLTYTSKEKQKTYNLVELDSDSVMNYMFCSH